MPLDCALHGGGTVSDVLSGCDSVLPCHHHVPLRIRDAEGPCVPGLMLAAAGCRGGRIGRVAAVTVKWPVRSPLLHLPEAVLMLFSLGLSSFSLNLCGHLLCLILKCGSAPALPHLPWTVLPPDFRQWLYARHPRPPPRARAHLMPAAHSAIPSNPSTVPAPGQVVAHL